MRQIIETLRLLNLNPKKYEQEIAESLYTANITIRQLLFMESFVEDLLNFQMITSGQFKLENKQFDPQDAITFVSDLTKMMAKQKGIEIEAKTL